MQIKIIDYLKTLLTLKNFAIIAIDYHYSFSLLALKILSSWLPIQIG